MAKKSDATYIVNGLEFNDFDRAVEHLRSIRDGLREAAAEEARMAPIRQALAKAPDLRS